MAAGSSSGPRPDHCRPSWPVWSAYRFCCWASLFCRECSRWPGWMRWLSLELSCSHRWSPGWHCPKSWNIYHLFVFLVVFINCNLLVHVHFFLCTWVYVNSIQQFHLYLLEGRVLRRLVDSSFLAFLHILQQVITVLQLFLSILQHFFIHFPTFQSFGSLFKYALGSFDVLADFVVDFDSLGRVFVVFGVLLALSFILSAPDGENEFPKLLDDPIILWFFVESEPNAILLAEQLLVNIV